MVALARPALRLGHGRSERALSEDDRILGSCCHGLFGTPAALLAWAGARDIAPVDFAARREADIDRRADAVEAALDWKALNRWT